MATFRSVVTAARTSGFGMALAGGLIGVPAALADHQFLIGSQAPANPSSFTLDFGPFGGQRTANITRTDLTLNLVQATGMARLTAYSQDVDPLLLPGDISTGDITVTIVPGTSTGTYNPATGTFTTTELYSISFTEDLSPFGLTSPVTLAGNSAGTIDFAGNTMQSQWAGVGQLANPSDPNNPITFTYTCTVNVATVTQPGCDGDANNDGVVNQDDLDLVLFGFGASTGQAGFDPLADFNGNGTVDQDDLDEALAAFGAACP